MSDNSRLQDNSIKSTITGKKERQPEFEILRVVSMLMVITLHYLQKGGLLSEGLSNTDAWHGLFWMLEILCLVSVNVYVLISGYFMVSGEFRLTKLVSLWGEVFFYSVVVALVMLLSGLTDYHQFLNMYEICFYLFPLSMGHYWFATDYVLIYMLSPLLVYGIRKLDKKQLGIVTGILILVFSVLRTFMPFNLIYDDCGVGLIWFIVLFVIAGYIRLYGLPFLDGKIKPLVFYVLLSLGTWTALLGTSIVSAGTGKYELLNGKIIDNNSILVLASSVCLFMFFKNIKIKGNVVTNFIVRIAPYTFGVYLLHEHTMINHRWIEWLRVSDTYGALRIVHIILTVIMIFCIGIFVDFVRSAIFKLIVVLWDIAMKIYNAKTEVWNYLIFGVLATVVNWIAYLLASRVYLNYLIKDNQELMVLISNTIAWVTAVVFAYWTNKNFVFKSNVSGGISVLKEFISFVLARVTTFVIEQILLFILLKALAMNDIMAKLVISVVVIVLNYIFSKLIIFKKDKVNNEK